MKYNIDTIRQFLDKRGWIIATEGTKFIDYYPSTSFKFAGAYKISLPRTTDAYDIDKYLYNLVTILAGLYNIPAEDLNAIFLNDVTILTLGIVDEGTKDGFI